MNKDKLLKILNKVYQNKITPEQAIEDLKILPFEDIGHTKIDFHRKLRTGIEEVIFGKNKTIDELIEIVDNLIKNSHNVLITKLQINKGKILKNKFPEGNYYEKAKIFMINQKKILKGNVCIICAGTSDIPIAEEAALTCEFFGSNVKRIFDVGIAGLHRLLDYKKDILNANIVIAVAGMEGALPSVVAGIFGKPIIAVPTSVGYGTGFNGISALLTMLNSCAPGIVVVNIDNGFGAGVFAHLINSMVE